MLRVTGIIITLTVNKSRLIDHRKLFPSGPLLKFTDAWRHANEIEKQ